MFIRLRGKPHVVAPTAAARRGWVRDRERRLSGEPGSAPPSGELSSAYAGVPRSASSDSVFWPWIWPLSSGSRSDALPASLAILRALRSSTVSSQCRLQYSNLKNALI